MSFEGHPEFISIYGDGSDGNINGTEKGITFTKDMYYNNFYYVGSTDTSCNLNGFRMYVKNHFILGPLAHVHSDGNSGDGNGDPSSSGPVGTVGNGGQGGAGGVGTSSPSWDGVSGENVFASLGGLGNVGGDGNSGIGGPEGVPFPPAAAAGNSTVWSAMFMAGRPTQQGGATKIRGGGGGGGGGGDADELPGASGGNGGNVVMIYARKISGNGRISANGGNGGDCPGFSDDAGGGGGGGGGVICIVSDTPHSEVIAGGMTIEVNGGVGGEPTGTGQPGLDGLEGKIFYIRNEHL